jgi:hypothetical protein
VPITIQRSGDLFEITFTGKITSTDLFRGARELAELEANEAVTPARLIDLSGVTELDLDFGSMQQFADARKQSQLKNPTRSGVFAPQPLQFGFARMYQSIQENPQLDVQVFHTRTEALAWLGE